MRGDEWNFRSTLFIHLLPLALLKRIMGDLKRRHGD